MQDYFTALFLGFIEGLTEFIPVSSTGHLLVLTEILGFRGPPGHAFEIFIQLGAILAVVVLYRRKLWHTATHLIHEKQSRAFALNLIVGTIPALIAGALGRDFIKTHLYNPTVIGAALLAGGIVLLILERRVKNPDVREVDHIPLKTAFLIGCFQACALMPGVSRSGATIAGGLALGLARPAAAEFSFFLAIPVMCAAVLYDTFKSWEDIIAGGYWGVMLAGFFAAFVTALAVLRAALYIIGRFGFVPFAWYRVLAGILILLFI